MSLDEQSGQGDVTQLTDEEKATIIELTKESQTFFETNNDGHRKEIIEVAMVFGSMRNNLQPLRALMLKKTLGGFGEFVKRPPTYLGGRDHDRIGRFIHKKTTHIPRVPKPDVETGCEAAVIYGTYDMEEPQLGYLLSWYKQPQYSGEHKVYVKAGELSRIMRIEWEEIKEKLHESTCISKYWDRETGAYAAAGIDKFGYLGANFDRMSRPPPFRGSEAEGTSES